MVLLKADGDMDHIGAVAAKCDLVRAFVRILHVEALVDFRFHIA